MDVGIDGTRSYYHLLSSDHFCTGSNDHSIGDSFHDAGIASFTDTNDNAILDTDVRLVNASPIDDESIGDDQVQHFAVCTV